jgi:hypothetical protein
MRRALLVLAIVLGVCAPARLDAATTIRPGDYMETEGIGCTLGFLADEIADGDPSTTEAVYFMTAAHCVDKIGDNVRDIDGVVFGDVAVKGNEDQSAQDWALVEVRPASVPQAGAAVRGLGVPTGVAAPGETAMLDVLRVSGHGIPWFIDPTLRENRYGVVGYHDNELYDAIAMDTNGDSGGPIVHEASGQAFGLVSRLCIGPCTSEGPTIQGVIAKAAAKGFDIKLRTA